MAMNQIGQTTPNSSFGTDQLRLVSFNVGKELFAVDILRVQEINRMMSLTQVPQSPPGVCGVINLRGRIVPVLDLRTRFGLKECEHCEESRIIVVEIKGATIGFIVDAVHEVLEINPSIIEEAPAITSSADARFIKGVAKMKDTLLILLDLDELMTTESLESAGAIKTQAA
ncbi:MAG: purine-binding chemotaxis protein CheW [Phycisphaerales bacterium]|nr:purine-binding chemotaxis protein CheW [Phycisphaerales bacterium]